ncbi:MAG: Amuc_1100 family pilus-like protein [Lentisphaeria bacterium]|nr:Amuc_1100 family pilus-like protein [Lentisphaeria bacterium]
MDFVKKNLGLLICGVVSFILACILLIFMFKTSGQMKIQNQKVQEQMAFFERVAQQGYKLTAAKGAELENLLQAQKNYEDAEQFYRSSRDFLAKTYSIEPELPVTSPDALKLINERVRQMTDFVLKNDINFPGLAKEFMDIVARGSVNTSEFAPVFRQLLIYEYLIRKIAEAGIKEIRQLELPLGFAVQEEDIYTITPIWLSFDCEPETAQNFLNQMTNDRKMLFYIKNVTMEAPDNVTSVAQDYQNANADRIRQATQAMGNDPGSELMPGEGPRRPENQRRVNPSGGRIANPGEQGVGETVVNSGPQSRFIVPDPKRQDYLIFARKYVVIEVRFDLYEFKKLEAR